MKGKLVWSVIWVLAGVLVIVVSMYLMAQVDLIRFRFPVLYATGVFVLLGVALLFLMVKIKVGGVLKKFLLLTGASAVGMPVSIFLHNVVSGLFNIEEPVFFILAVFVCPIGVLVGAVGTIVLAIKSK